jgi:hypothetical protein
MQVSAKRGQEWRRTWAHSRIALRQDLRLKRGAILREGHTVTRPEQTFHIHATICSPATLMNKQPTLAFADANSVTTAIGAMASAVVAIARLGSVVGLFQRAGISVRSLLLG